MAEDGSSRGLEGAGAAADGHGPREATVGSEGRGRTAPLEPNDPRATVRAAIERATDVGRRLEDTRRLTRSTVRHSRVLRDTIRRERAQSSLERPPDAQPTRESAPLTARQVEILRLVADGVSTREIAARLFLSLPTVRNHIAAALRALDAHSRLQAVAEARRRRLL